MAILSKGTTYADGGQITSTNLNALVDSATFAAGAVESGGGLQLNGSSPAQLKVAGNVDIGTSNLTATGTISLGATTFNDNNITNVGSIAVDTIIADNTDVTIDAAGDIILDADGAQVRIKDGGTERFVFNLGTAAELDVIGDSVTIHSNTSDADIIFKGNDGGSTVTALTLDMSDAGAATFNNKVVATELDISGDVDIGGIITISDATPIIRTISNSEDLTLRGGNTDAGGQIRLYGSTASSTGNDIHYFANEHEFWNTGATSKIAFNDNEISFGSAQDVNLYRSAADTLKTDDSFEVVGNIDVDGTTNLDVVDIDGAVDMATTLTVAGNVDFNGDLDVDGTTNLDVVDIDDAVDMASTLAVGGLSTFTGNISVKKDTAFIVLENAAGTDLGFITDSGTWGDSGTDFTIGASSANLRFYTNNSSTERMRLSSDGKLGIGKTPSTTLDVNGTLAVSGNVDFNGDLDVDGTTNLDVVDIDGAVDMASTLSVSGNVGIFSGNVTGKFAVGSSAVHPSIAFYNQNDAYFNGATTINGAAQFDSTLTVGVNDTGKDVKFFGATSGASMLWDESADRLCVTGPDYQLKITQISSGAVWYNRVASNGSYSLHLNGTGDILTATASGVTVTSLSGVLANGVTATTQSDGDNSTKVATTAYVDAATGGGEGGAFTTLTASGDVNFDSGTFFTDVSANRVGILNTSPSVALDVTGELNLSSHATLGSNLSLKKDTDAWSSETWLNVSDYGVINTGGSFALTINGNGYRGTAGWTSFGKGSEDGATQIWQYPAGYITFNANNNWGTTTDGSNKVVTERMRIDGDGNIGIGENSPDVLLHVGTGSIYQNKTGSGAFPGTTDTTSHGFMAESQGAAGSTIHVSRTNSAAGIFARQGTGDVVLFNNTNSSVTEAGSIEITGASSVAYRTSSDYRLKENVVDVTDGIDRVKELNPVRFNFIGEDPVVDGFLAHEVQDIVPEAIGGEKDGMKDEEYEVSPAVYEDVVHPAVEATYDEDGNELTPAQEEYTESVLVTEALMGTRTVPKYQGIDQSKLVPLLTAALQEAVAKIEDLEARVQTLEG